MDTAIKTLIIYATTFLHVPTKCRHLRQNSTISEILANCYMNVSVDNSDHDGVVRIFLRSS